MIGKTTSTNNRQGLTAQSTVTGVQEYLTSTGGALNIGTASGGVTDTLETTGLIPKVYDSITYTATSGTVDTYKYYTGGTGGTLVATLTVTYTDSSHATLVSAVRT